MEERKQRVTGRGDTGPDIRVLLEKIEKEAVPERLLELAERLQAALLAQNSEFSSDGEK